MALVDIRGELHSKVALMRSLGVVEMETSSGFVRRLVLSPEAPESLPEEPPAAPSPEAPESLSVPDADEAKAKAAKAKLERRTFGAGR